MKKEEKVLNETEEKVAKKEAEKPEEKGGTHATGVSDPEVSKGVPAVESAGAAGTVSKGVPANESIQQDTEGAVSSVEDAASRSGEATVSKDVPGDSAAENEEKGTVDEAAKETPKAEEDLAAKWSGNIINKEWCENYLKNTTMGRITMICSVLLLICLAVLCVMTFIVMFSVRSA